MPYKSGLNISVNKKRSSFHCTLGSSICPSLCTHIIGWILYPTQPISILESLRPSLSQSQLSLAHALSLHYA